MSGSILGKHLLKNVAYTIMAISLLPSPVLPPGADLHRKQWVKLNGLRCATTRDGDTSKLWGAQESATCACGHITQSVQHVVVDGMIHKAPDGFAGLRCPDAATRSWLEDLNIEI